MTRALLDVNVWLALVDPDHEAHEAVHTWFGREGTQWASCAITQNGFVRIICQPRYPNPLSPAQAVEVLQAATSVTGHAFWPCDISLVDAVRGERLLGHRQVTDAYLLALAVAHGGHLVTLDRAAAFDLVLGAEPRHLTVL